MSLPEVLEVGTCDSTDESLLMEGLLPKPHSGSLQTPALTQTFPLGWPGREDVCWAFTLILNLPRLCAKIKNPRKRSVVWTDLIPVLTLFLTAV